MTTKEMLQIINYFYTDTQIGEMVGLNQSSICRLRNGSSRHTSDISGVKIKALYDKVKRRKTPERA